MNTQARLFTNLSRTMLVAGMLFVTLGFASGPAVGQTSGVQVVKNEAEHRVDVLVDGKLFTSYIWPKSLKTPTLYPLRTVHGTAVTRGFPLEARPGERVDHPHHVGFWLNYGKVNGVDFWNSSSVLPPEQQAKMGSIAHRRITRATSGKERGELEVEMDWIMPDGQPVLRETTKFIFHGGTNLRAVDRITTLTAVDKRVLFADDKEGMLGMRVRRELEQPSNEPLVFTDASGRATDVKVMDNKGVSGQYRSSEGKIGDAVWGTRGRWTTLTGKVDKEAVTLVILDHPKNTGFPTYWHARGYGLFAANPLGQEVFSNGKEKLNFALEPKQSVTFSYRLLILSGAVSPEQVEKKYSRFVKGVN